MNPLLNRMIRAAKFDVSLYEEVEADTTATQQAVIVVVLSSLASGIGALAFGQPVNFVIGTIGSLIGWYIWAYMIYLIGTKILPEPQTKADHGELLRTLGFAAAPGILRVLGIIAPLTSIVFTISNFWMLATMVIAIRQALDYQKTWRAVLVCVIGWAIQIAVLSIFLSLAGVGSGG